MRKKGMRYIAEDLALWVQWVSLLGMPVFLGWFVITFITALKQFDPLTTSGAQFDNNNPEQLRYLYNFVLALALFLISTSYRAILKMSDKISKLVDTEGSADLEVKKP